MKNRGFKLVVASLIITAGAVMAANTNPNGASTDTQIAEKVAHEMRMYSRSTIWDNIAVRVREGDVELTGQVSQPFKKADLGRLAQRVAGVRSVTNQLEVLPTSFFDDYYSAASAPPSAFWRRATAGSTRPGRYPCWSVCRRRRSCSTPGASSQPRRPSASAS